jgi:hypothetical protein
VTACWYWSARVEQTPQTLEAACVAAFCPRQHADAEHLHVPAALWDLGQNLKTKIARPAEPRDWSTLG